MAYLSRSAPHIEAMSAEEPTTSAATAVTPIPAASAVAAENNEGQSGSANREPASSGAATTAAEEIIGDFEATDFGVHKSIRYHAKRRAFFDTMHRIMMLIAIIGGSAAFFSLVGEHTAVGRYAALAVAVATALDLVFALSEKAREHDKLSERFCELAMTLASVDKEHLDRRQVAELKTRRLNLEKNEPTALEALNVICHNEEAEARGYDKTDCFSVGRFQKLIAQFCTLPWFSPEPLASATT